MRQNRLNAKTLLSIFLLAIFCTSCGKTLVGDINDPSYSGSLDENGYNSSINGEDLSLGGESNGWDSEGNIPNANEGKIFKDIYFGYDSSVIPEEARAQIEQNAQYLNQYSNLKVEIEGHCDERGTNEYNFALGEARAKSVGNLLSNYGVDSSRISTISYGEEIPLNPGSSDSSYAQNRRVHFAVYKNKR